MEGTKMIYRVTTVSKGYIQNAGMQKAIHFNDSNTSFQAIGYLELAVGEFLLAAVTSPPAT